MQLGFVSTMRSGMWTLAFVVAASALAFAQTIDVRPLARDGQLLVSFEVRDAITSDVEAAIQSGLPTTFTYDVELRRGSATWVDRTLDTARVVVTVRFDNLTRRYQVSLTQDGRVEQVHVTEDLDVVRQWCSAFTRLPLFSTRDLEANAEYYIRVRGRTKPRNSMFSLPWDRTGVAGSAKFTFLPR
ncbi:MAG: DUF4390 domain-containing protein [Vicinamibacterales bacterium]